ncbi:MAG: hypothetical protein P8I75_06950, partial [Flavobacteriaceae bacterium]|nr:hypothetical protein [Flavobacteriaceae bacterium]
QSDGLTFKEVYFLNCLPFEKARRKIKDLPSLATGLRYRPTPIYQIYTKFILGYKLGYKFFGKYRKLLPLLDTVIIDILFDNQQVRCFYAYLRLKRLQV